MRDSRVTHSGIAALTVKDAIVDQFRARRGARPNVNVDDPDLPLKLVIRRDVAALYRDLSGASLHKRGWRPIQVKSPLNEALAAGLLLLTGWDRASPLVDPMCGSGTFLIEAAHLAMDRAPGLERAFAFQRWPDFDAAAWDRLVADARRAHPAPPPSSSRAPTGTRARSSSRQDRGRGGGRLGRRCGSRSRTRASSHRSRAPPSSW